MLNLYLWISWRLHHYFSVNEVTALFIFQFLEYLSSSQNSSQCTPALSGPPKILIFQQFKIVWINSIFTTVFQDLEIFTNVNQFGNHLTLRPNLICTLTSLQNKNVVEAFQSSGWRSLNQEIRTPAIWKWWIHFHRSHKALVFAPSCPFRHIWFERCSHSAFKYL